MSSFLLKSGIAVGYFLAALIVKRKEDIPNLALSQAIIATVGLLITLALFKDAPPTPPSKTATTQKTTFRKSMGELLRNRNFWLILVAFGLSIDSTI